jgi:methylenetetrahydrofolate reductase (NADPH)
MPEAPVRIGDLIAEGGKSYSFEFFPPKDEDGERVLWQSISELEPLRPTFVSVTYGAGGTTREGTIRVTSRIAKETSLTPMAHLTCVGHTAEELRAILRAYAEGGVHNVMVLRGDPTDGPGTAWTATEGGFNYASELVELVHSLDGFGIGVAAFPEGHRDAASLEADALVMRRKYDAGADFAVTEMFFRASDYFGLVERCAANGVDFPIIPGIMPITNLRSVERMTELSGRDVPPEVLARFEGVTDPAEVRRIGIEVATELCDKLLAGGAPGLHFYTLNRSKATREIYAGLGSRV